MNIVFDHQIFTFQRHGGVSRYIVSLAENLVEMGHQARVVAPFHINAYLGSAHGTLNHGCSCVEGRMAGKIIKLANMALTPYLTKRIEPQIVHETYYQRTGQVPRSARTVLTVYDMIHEKFARDFDKDDRTAINKAAAIDRADHIICISESTRRDLIDFYPHATAKSSVVYLGFTDPKVANAGSRARDRPYILFVGRRSSYKNFQGLLLSYSASPALRADFDLIAVGGGAFSDDERKAVHDLGLEQEVLQVDADDAQLTQWYRDAQVFVYPSLYEGFGIPPLEAMAVGTPVVAVRCSSLPEICGDAAAYASDGSADALQGAIESVVFSADVSNRLRNLGHARLASFAWRKCAEETAIVYRNLL